jgi:amino acid transporter
MGDSDGKNAVQMEAKLSLTNGVGIIIGNIIGSGIFISPKGVLEASGSIGMSLILWVACGVYSSLGALCYAELGTTMKTSGGDYVYIHEAFGPIVAFMQLWVTMLVIRPACQAIISVTFAQYLVQPFVGDCDMENEIKAIAIVALMLITFINCTSVKLSTFINDSFMVAKILSLVLIIVTGAYYMFAEGRVENYNNAFEGTKYEPTTLSMAFYSGMFAYAGWNYLNFMTDEIDNPNRNLPLAIVISMPLVTTIYVLANVAYFSAMSVDQLLASPAVGITFAETYLGPISWIMPILVAMSTFSATNGSILTGSRLTFIGAKYKQLPQLLAMVNTTFLTPIPSVLLTGIVSVLMVLPGNIGDVMVYFSFVFYFTIDLAVCALIYLRLKHPNWERPIKLPLILPILFVIICSFILGCSVYEAPYVTGVGILATLSALPVYFIFIVFSDKLDVIGISSLVEKVTVVLQKLLSLCLEEAVPVGKETAIQLDDMKKETNA